MFVRRMVFFPLISIEKGPPACMEGNTIFHFPWLSALDEILLPLKAMVTFSRESAQPQRVIGAFLCNTILLLIMRGILIFPHPVSEFNPTIARTRISRIREILLLSYSPIMMIFF
jgi:hypothetical protein